MAAQTYCPLSRVHPELLALLPSYYLLKVDISRLDTAFTNKKLRPLWLEALRMMLSSGDLNEAPRKSFARGSFWKLVRRVPVTWLWFPCMISQEFSFIGPPLHSIVELHISGMSYSIHLNQPINAIYALCPNLKKLFMDNMDIIDKNTLCGIGICPHLSSLSLMGRYNHEVATSLLHELGLLGHQIDDLEIQTDKFSEVLDTIVVALPNLRSLALSAWSHTDPLENTHVQQLATAYPSLHVLKIAAVNISLVGARIIVCSFPQLRVLDISIGNDENCFLLAQYCPLLETIYLYGSSSISDAGVIAIVRGCPSLQRVSLLYMETITDAALAAIAGHCPRLKYFVLYHWVFLTIPGILHLVQTAAALEELYLSRFSASAPRVAAGSLPALRGPLRLQRMDVSMSELDDDMVRMFTESCPDLTFIKLYSCKSITPACLEHFRPLTRLRTLTLQSCAMPLTPDDVLAVQTNMPKVKVHISS